MNFRTELLIPPSPFRIGLHSQLLSIGSCFAEVIGQQLTLNKLAVSVNPFGTLFSPLAICKVLELSLGKQALDERLFVQTPDDVWVHYDFHSSLRATTPEALQEQIKQQLEHTRRWIVGTNVLLLTFGTAHAYRLLTPPSYVANCHKQPKAVFERDLLSVKDICRGFASVYQVLKETNPNLRIVLTVSPVRHTNDGIPQNALSKAILRAACHYVEADFADVAYFPSYELMMDDLRDYRFYKADLIHPNEIAEAYIFEKFAEAYFEPALQTFVKEWRDVRKALQHRPFNPDSATHQQFLRNTLHKLRALHTSVEMSQEIATLERQLK